MILVKRPGIFLGEGGGYLDICLEEGGFRGAEFCACKEDGFSWVCYLFKV